MSEIQGIARQKINPGKLDEFKRLAAECMRVAREKDTGTLQYDFYLNADETECIAVSYTHLTLPTNREV